MKEVVFACGLLFACFGHCARVEAQGRAGASSNRTSRAPDRYTDLISEAVREFSANNFIEARTLFEQAHAQKPSARTLRALGLCAYELKHYVQAVEELGAALSDAREPLTATQHAEVNTMLDKAKRYVGTLVIETEPAQVDLLIDGQPQEAREVDLDVGEHVLAASAPGYHAVDQKVSVLGGRKRVTRVLLSPLDVSPTRVASTNLPDANAAPRTAPAQEPRDEPGVLSRWWFWTAAGAVVAGAVVGSVFAFKGDSQTAMPNTGTTDVKLQPP